MQNAKATAAKANSAKATAAKATAAKASNTAATATGKAGAQALAGRIFGLPTGLQPGAFVAVHTLVNPKVQGSRAHNSYAALLALVTKYGNGKFTAAQWAAAVGRASDLRYNTNNGGKGGRGKPFVTTHATQALAVAAVAPVASKAKVAAKAKAVVPVAIVPVVPVVPVASN